MKAPLPGDDLLNPLLELVEVQRIFRRGAAALHAVDGVSLSVGSGESVGLIGESGSGKSTLGRLALGLQPCDGGTVRFGGNDLRALSHPALQQLRSQMTIVFQEPQESLNPRMRVGAIVEEPLKIHRRDMPGPERRAQVMETLRLVALDPGLYDRYPAKLSGGQQQRVSIARAIVTRPKFIVLDEPTSALDLSVQAQILELLRQLQRELGLAYLFISHDIDCVAYGTERVGVMYRGRIVEFGPTESVLGRPRHPYTQELLSSILPLDPDQRLGELTIRSEGAPESGSAIGCGYYSLCPYQSDPRCRTERPKPREVAPGHWVASFCEP